MAESPSKRKPSKSDDTDTAKVAKVAKVPKIKISEEWKKMQKEKPPYVRKVEPEDLDMPMYEDMDDFVGIPEVIALDDFLLEDFIQKKDAAMIFFYDPTLPGMLAAREEFRQAAQTTKRANHGYAAFNCDYYKDLCRDMFLFDVSLPHYKLFTEGNYVGGYYANLTAKEIKKLVETAPLADLQPIGTPCSGKKR